MKRIEPTWLGYGLDLKRAEIARDHYVHYAIRNALINNLPALETERLMARCCNKHCPACRELILAQVDRLPLGPKRG